MAERRTRPEAGAVLDIGGDVGAILVYTSAELCGREIELYAADGRVVTHTEVHRRDLPGGPVYAGLFQAVREGRYLVEDGGGAAVPVVVKGGEVSTVGAGPRPPAT